MNRPRSLLLLAACTLLAVAGCRYVDPEFQSTVTRNIVYGDAINEDGQLEQLKLDLYTPAGDSATNRPVVIWAHGGSFVSGDKSTGAAWATEYARRGYVAASINYRMDEDGGPVTNPPDAYETQRINWAIADMKAAIRWFRANAASLGIDPGKIAVAGSSAGAVMAVSTAVTPDDPGDTGDHLAHSSAVCTAISVSGATDPALVDAGDAGALFFHGDLDTTVPYSLAVATRDAMTAAGLRTKLHTFAGQGHGISGSHRVEILDKTYGWLIQRVVNAPEPCI
ncbi:MAG: alpha/beta hydrolase [Acidimicrobiia bacterium]